jgi:hypothetical protein
LWGLGVGVGQRWVLRKPPATYIVVAACLCAATLRFTLLWGISALLFAYVVGEVKIAADWVVYEVNQ